MLRFNSRSDKVILATLFFLVGLGSLTNLSAQSENSLRLLYPNGGETLAGGTSVTIRWMPGERSNQDKYRLEYSTNGGVDWNLIDDVERDTSYAWTVPLTASSSCMLRVTKTRGVAGSGDSVMAFRVPWYGTQFERPGALQCRYSRDGSKLVCWQRSHIGIRDMETDEWLWWDTTDYQGPSTAVLKVLFDWNAERVLVCGGGWTESNPPHAEVWDVNSGQRIAYLPFTYENVPIDLVEVLDGVFFPDNPNHVLVVGRLRSTLFDIAKEERIDSTLYNNFFVSCDIRPDGRQALIGTYDGRVQLRATDDWSLLHRFTHKLNRVEFSLDGESFLLSGPADTGNVVELRRLSDLSIRSSIKKEWVAAVAGIPVGDFSSVTATMSDAADVFMTSNFGESWIWYPNESVPRFRLVDRSVPNSNGRLYSDLHPDGTRVLAVQLNGDVVLWSLTADDVSDALFTIGGPAPVVSGGNFGLQKIGTTRDSVFQSLIRNDGTVPVQLNEVRLVSGDVDAFSLASPVDPVSLAPGESIPVAFRFAPVDSGSHSVVIEARTDAGVVSNTIHGIGAKGIFRSLVTAFQVNLGEHTIGFSIDTLITLVANVGNAPLGITHLGVKSQYPAQDPYWTVGTPPAEVAPGDTLQVNLGFNPPMVKGGYSTFIGVRDEYGRTISWQVIAGIFDTTTAVAAGEMPVAGESSMLVERIVPNPAHSETAVYVRSIPKGNFSMRIIDQLGRELDRIDPDNAGCIMVDLSALPVGLYMIEARTDSKTELHKLVIER